MKVGIMQPYFFPYIGYWQLIHAVDKYVVYDDVTYIKGGWINRNNILLGGKKHLVTLPLFGASSFKNINEIEITPDAIARRKVLRTLESAYQKAPYFAKVMPMIERLIMECNKISELNYRAIKEICAYIGIDTEIILSSEMEKDVSLKGVDKVLHINRILGADTYINAPGGKALYSGEIFADKGIALRFLEMQDISYRQYREEFVPGLSILDVLMFNAVTQIRGYLDRYKLAKA